MTKTKIKTLDWGVFLLCDALFGFGCQAVEYTGRSQLSLVSEGDEKKLGVDAYEDILKKTPLSKNQAWQAQLKPDGRLVLPLSLRGPQVSVAFEQAGGHLRSVSVADCGYMMLRGAFAWASTG